jgi:hypothetical protein
MIGQNRQLRFHDTVILLRAAVEQMERARLALLAARLAERECGTPVEDGKHFTGRAQRLGVYGDDHGDVVVVVAA